MSYRVVLLFLLMCLVVNSHQPRIAQESDLIVVENPEISKAYYGELKGEPATYTFSSEQEINIYINLLVPYTGTEKHEVFSAELLDAEGKQVALLDGYEHNWTTFYEEFGQDTYWKGPELGEDFKSTGKIPAGTYYIKVFNENNTGKYVLAVGDKESFPITEIINAIITVPIIKFVFFGKPEMLIFALLFIVGIGVAVYFLVTRKKIKKKKKRKELLAHSS